MLNCKNTALQDCDVISVGRLRQKPVTDVKHFVGVSTAAAEHSFFKSPFAKVFLNLEGVSIVGISVMFCFANYCFRITSI